MPFQTLPATLPLSVTDRFGHLLGLLNTGLYCCPAVDDVTPLTQPQGSEYLELVTGGVVLDADAGPEKECGPGTLFWHVPGERSIHRTRAATPYRCLFIRFAVTAPNRQVPHRTWPGDGQWANAFAAEVMNLVHGPRRDPAALCTSLYARFLLAAMGNMGAKMQGGSGDGAAVGRPVVLDRLLWHLDRTPSLLMAGVEQLADTVNISRAHLHQLCRDHLNTTPHQLLLERRLHQAKCLLAAGSLTVKGVAAECGFDNVETLCRAFRRLTGSSPGHYRRIHSRNGR